MNTLVCLFVCWGFRVRRRRGHFAPENTPNVDLNTHCTVCCKSIAPTRVSQGAWPIQFERPWSGDPTTGHSPPLTCMTGIGSPGMGETLEIPLMVQIRVGTYIYKYILYSVNLRFPTRV